VAHCYRDSRAHARGWNKLRTVPTIFKIATDGGHWFTCLPPNSAPIESGSFYLVAKCDRVTRTIMPSTTRNNTSNEPSPRPATPKYLSKKSTASFQKNGPQWMEAVTDRRFKSQVLAGWACLHPRNTPCQFLNWTLGQRLPAHRRKQTGMTVRDTALIGRGPVMQSDSAINKPR
jgi:hypothetical protein